jgi:MerR family transcriptional regulator, copper efflux regulator
MPQLLPSSPKHRPHRAPSPLLSCGQLRAQTGLTRGALRLYEREGLIRAEQRTAAGYRVFASECVDRVHAILIAKSVGFTLAEIRDILRLIDAKNFSRARMSALLKGRLEIIDARIRQLGALRKVIAAAMKTPEALVDPDCSLLREFALKGGMRSTRKKT